MGRHSHGILLNVGLPIYVPESVRGSLTLHRCILDDSSKSGSNTCQKNAASANLLLKKALTFTDAAITAFRHLISKISLPSKAR